MPKFLVIAITNNETVFIYDTYNDYIVNANSKEDAEKLSMSIPHFKDVDTVSNISDENAEALMKINRTKQINDNITQIIMF